MTNSPSKAARQRLTPKEWLDLPENDIGFDPHKSDEDGPICGGAVVDATCERCAVEIALGAYAAYLTEATAAPGGEPASQLMTADDGRSNRLVADAMLRSPASPAPRLEIIETLKELEEFISELARSAMLSGEAFPEEDEGAFYSEACKAKNKLTWLIDELVPSAATSQESAATKGEQC